jgi:Flp pilus assembly pilin Flp
MSERIVGIFRDEDAAPAREYGLMAVAIVVAVLVVILGVTFVDVSSAITS